MTRRRLMMQQQSGTKNIIDLLEDYKLSYKSVYRIESLWSGSTLTLRHTSAGFVGPNQAYQQFIGTEQKSGSSTYAAFSASEATLPTLDNKKRYRLTLTVLNVNYNNAVDSTSGTLTVSLGIRPKYYSQDVSLCELTAGASIVLEMPDPTGFRGAVFGATGPNTTWSFDFDVKLEEV